MKLVLIWIQGSWKWTQARILQEKYGFEIFETGQALRNITKQETELGKLVKETIEAGKQVTPEIIENIIKNYLENTNSDKIIFDGLVRNEWNKKTADYLLWDYKVLFFELDEKEAMNRLLWRMYNPKIGATYPAWTETDPKTGDKLIKRTDDEENAIKQRIKEFFEKTMPVVEQYEKEWKLLKINANQNIENVTKDIINLLWL